MSQLLQRFNADERTKEELVDYLTAFIASEGVRRIFNREDVSAVADAKELLDRAFEQLKQDYGAPEQRKAPANEAK